MTPQLAYEWLAPKLDISERKVLDVIFNENLKLKEDMERAAIACSHGESKMAQDILLKALGQ